MNSTQTTLKQFYSQYKSIRIELFTHLKQQNPGKDHLQLFSKTQKLLDRFIFVCFCQNANLLPDNTLRTIKESIKNSFVSVPNRVWCELKGLFQSIEMGNPVMDIPQFNGGLFYKDEELDSLIIQDSILLKLIGLSEYDFVYDLNVNALGYIFEQSLVDIEEIKAQIANGKPLSPDGKMDIRKNGRRKKEGIFYTPDYITRYMVKEAIGGWLEDRKRELGFYNLPQLSIEDMDSIKSVRPQSKEDGRFYKVLEYNERVKQHLVFWEAYQEALRSIRVLDPACGAGVFLHQVFDFLYTEGGRVNEAIGGLRGGQPERVELDRHILTQNIFGVDLNPESVEITKLSLWLKTAQKEKELIALGDNIKCGNSLIDDPALVGIHAFDWGANFPEVFPSGFDVIIGNPPYGTSFSPLEKSYLKNRYGNVPDYETYIYFISRGRALLHAKGVLSYIVPNTFLSTLYGESYRRKVLDNHSIIGLTDLSQDPTFKDASVRTCIFTFKKEKKPDCLARFNTLDVLSKNIIPLFEFNPDQLKRNLKNWLSLFSFRVEHEGILEVIKKHPPLGDYCDISQGLIPYDTYRGHDPYTIKNRIWHSSSQKDGTYRKELKGGDITRYLIQWNGELWLSYGHWLAAPREPKFFTAPRILIREIVNRSLYCAYTTDEYYNTPSIINVVQKNGNLSLKYILAILNSRLIFWYHLHTSPKAVKGLFPKILVHDVRLLPIPLVAEEEQQPLIDNADTMMTFHNQWQQFSLTFIQLLQRQWPNLKITGKMTHWHNLSFEAFHQELKKQKIKLSLPEQTQWTLYFGEQKKQVETIQSRIATTDNIINEQVYALYGLTQEEIQVLERQ